MTLWNHNAKWIAIIRDSDDHAVIWRDDTPIPSGWHRYTRQVSVSPVERENRATETTHPSSQVHQSLDPSVA